MALYIHHYLPSCKCKSNICKTEYSLWKTRYNVSSAPYNKPVQFRKYLETIKFHEEAVVTRKTSQPHLFSTLTILYTVRNHFLSMCSILFCISLLLLSSAIIPWHKVLFKSRCLPLIPGIPLSRESQGIPREQTIPVNTSGQKQYLSYHRITIT